ncbi:MAG: type I phosphomannose isomerase catalytic subunit [Planctomycetaceae bacterium]
MLPLECQPILKRIRWGGRRLERLGKNLGEGHDYAESWELADHGDDQSVVLNGEHAGWTLRRLVEEKNAELFGRHAGLKQFPLLVKFLDANDRLSVQVHPNDEQAKQYAPHENGKTEAWVIVDAEPGAKLYAGLKEGVTPDQLRQASIDGTVENLLHSFEVSPGECVFIPAGTVHAIGAGILLAEIQQMSNLTFRLFDWGWVDANGKPRQIHLEESLACTDFARGPARPVDPHRHEHRHGVTDDLVRSDYFEMRRHVLERDHRLPVEDHFRILTVLKGTGDLVAGDASMRFSLGRTVLIPAECPQVTIHPLAEMIVLEACVP